MPFISSRSCTSTAASDPREPGARWIDWGELLWWRRFETSPAGLMETQQEELEEEGSRLVQPDLIKSYLAFGLRAVRKHRLWVVAILVVGVSLTVAIAVLWPRTYHCEMKLMAQKSKALGGE